MNLSRRKILSMLAGGGAMVAFGDGFFVEPHLLDVTEHVIPNRSSSENTIASVAQITDLHLRTYGQHEQDLIAELFRLNPDILLFTGDIIDDYKNMDILENFLWDLPDTPLKFAIPGNWEHEGGVDFTKLRSLYRQTGINFLVNESITGEIHGKQYLITGVDDYVESTPDLRTALNRASPSQNHLLLAHCPGYRDEVNALIDSVDHPWIDDYRFQGMFSGHTHGGQVTIFGFAPILPRGTHGYTAGWYRDGGIPLYVSRGIASTGIPVRFMCPPELATFRWQLV